MKTTAFLINTSRGPIINEEDLVRALQEEKIAGAGIDVYEKEPLPEESQTKIFTKCFFNSTHWLRYSRKLYKILFSNGRRPASLY